MKYPRFASPLGKFVVTGAVGFAVDAGVLTLLVAVLDWGPIVSRAISFPVALCITWLLNRVWTFKRTDQHYFLQSIRYGIVQVCGAGVNLAAYAVLIASGPSILARVPVIGLALASMLAMLVTYLGSRYWAFAGPNAE